MNTLTSFKIYSSIFLVLQIVCIYFKITKKISNLKKMVIGLNIISNIVAIIFFAEAVFCTENLYLRIIGLTMIYYGSFMHKSLKNENK